MHIVLPNRWYPPHSGFGGIGMYNYYLSRAMVRLNNKVTVIANRWSDEAPACEQVDGVHVSRILTRHRYWMHRLPIVGRYMRGVLQLLYSAQVAKAINSICEEDRVDIVEFAEVGAEGYIYLHKSSRCPVVVRCHTPTTVLRQHYLAEEMPFSNWLTEHMEGYCICNADLITTPSNDMACVIANTFEVPRDKIITIPNPLDVADFALRDKRVEDVAEHELIILHVGRLDRVKGVEVLAQAIPMVLEIIPNSRFVFLGAASSDEKAKYWMEQLKRAGGGQISVLGFVEQIEMVNWYHRSDIAVVPSLNYESFSYTCAQALAAGLPVIASDIGGISETIDDGINGLLFPPGDSVELAKAILYLLMNEELRISFGEMAERMARQNFCSEKIAKQTLDQYQEIL